jgi:RNA polymerase sigma-70 factor (ECF subfamily)
MNRKNLLAEQFETNRNHLRAVAYRMLGSRSEADDAVQETWLRLNRTDTAEVSNLGGWLTTVVARICLDVLRARRARREEPLGPHVPEPVAETTDAEAMMADSVGAALLVVLETLSPAERLAFVLHDMFAMSFEDIAPVVGRSVVATRQLASRARRRVQGAAPAEDADLQRDRKVVDAFLAASRNGDFAALLEVLDPEIVFRADPVAVRMGSLAEIHGAAAVAEVFKGRAQAAKPALVDGAMGVAVIFGGRLRIVLAVTIEGDRIREINAIADPDGIGAFEVVPLEA